MKLFIQKIPESGRVYEVDVNAAKLRQRLADRTDIMRLSDLHAQVNAERIEQVVTLRGEVVFDLFYVCSRCADEMEATIRLPLRMVLMPRSERPGPAEEDEDSGYHNGRVIDLSGIILEQVALQLPQVLLCDIDCKGLCPVCNANLNDGPCDCGAKEKG